MSTKIKRRKRQKIGGELTVTTTTTTTVTVTTTVGPASDKSVALWPGFHVCTPACEFRRVRPDKDDEFKCVVSGFVHNCGIKQCNVQLRTDVGVQCRLTKLLIERTVADTALVVGDPLFEDHAKRSDLKVQEDRDEISKAHVRLAPKLQIQKSWQALDDLRKEEKLQERHRALAHLEHETTELQQKHDPEFTHVCAPGECQFVTHEDIGPDVYSCAKTGRVHVCGKKCTAITKQLEAYVCAVTGHMLGDVFGKPTYIQMQSMRIHRTDGPSTSKKRKKAMKRKKKNGLPAGYKHIPAASEIVYDILFSDRRRQSDLERLQRATQEGLKEVKNYCKRQRAENKQINTCILEILYTNAVKSYAGQARLNVTPDRERCNYYARRCVEFWRRINLKFDETKMATHMRIMVIGYLYMQQKGLQYEGQTIVEADAYLEQVGLPDESTLHVFDVNNGHYTKIVKTIRHHLTDTLREKPIDDVRLPQSDEDALEQAEILDQHFLSS